MIAYRASPTRKKSVIPDYFLWDEDGYVAVRTGVGRIIT